ncbi:amidohydrolase family protein [Saccharopolyspora sp. WRP15-2]|uniref:Amidohydrolase family protein n=1 Tax=Saccharopolyspora oryzae TaxID=2997343 RepID=A0ABT4V2M3_9PSEU|nr:amidohydrolase family protein [Saccharopolyspora oryzae]MDA3628198.1 amidohydrolase family protein [Saccharopolyspora oryzae]
MAFDNTLARGSASGVHPPIREGWLELTQEPLAVPEVRLVDAHHHLWDRQGSRYLLEEFLRDLDTVPAVAATVYVQCRSRYLTDGPEELKSAGEVRFARASAEAARESRPGGPEVCRAIVAGAELTLGANLGRVLDVLADEAGGRLRGVRNQTAWHADPRVVSSPRPAQPDQLLDPRFHDGARLLGRRGLTLDVWAYHTQLDQVTELVRACPDTTIVVDHFGGPLGVGPYAERSGSVFENWLEQVTELARYPTVHMKLSGAGLRVFGFRFDERATPPSSDELAAVMGRYLDACLERFGPRRCMFASNFPVDKGMFGYRVLWNAFAKAAARLSAAEQADLFHATADSVYRLDLSQERLHA